MKKEILFVGSLCLLAIISFPSKAQQDPTYSQYLNNPVTVNPAYAGINNRFNATFQYRAQWSDVEGHPETFNFNSHISLKENKLGAGLMAIQDKLGENKMTEVSTLWSYKIKFKESTFSFGMQAGFMRFTNDNSGLNFQQAGDKYFPIYNVTKFNTGAGVMLKSDRYLIGISVPRLLPVSIDQGTGQSFEVYSRNYYLMASYMVYLTERVRLRPSVLVHTTDKLQTSIDLNMNLQIEDFYSAGIFTRNLNTYGVLLQMVLKNYRFGYAIEVPASKSAIPFTTNEFMLGISLRALASHDHSVSVY